MRMPEVVDLSQVWAFYFDWGFAVITGVTWSYLIVLIRPDDYTELSIICPYCMASTMLYPAGAWLLKLRFEKNSRRAPLTGSLSAKKRYKLLSAIDMLLIPSFTMACSTGYSLLFTVIYNYYFANAVESSSAGVATLFWVGSSAALHAGVFLLEVGLSQAEYVTQLCADSWHDDYEDSRADFLQREQGNGGVDRVDLKESLISIEAESPRDLRGDLRGDNTGRPGRRARARAKVERGGLLFIAYIPYFFNIVGQSFGSTVGFFWNYTILQALELLAGADTSNQWGFWLPKAVVVSGLCLGAAINLDVADEGDSIWRRRGLHHLNGMLANLSAFAWADFWYYLTCYHIAQRASYAIGHLWLWVLSAWLMFATPHFVKWVQGGVDAVPLDSRWNKARAFVVHQAKLMGCYTIWYVWYDDICDLSESELMAGWGEPEYTLGRIGLILGTSIAPACVIGAAWVVWFYVVKTPLWEEDGTATEASDASVDMGYYECFVEAKANEKKHPPSLAFAIDTLKTRGLRGNEPGGIRDSSGSARRESDTPMARWKKEGSAGDESDDNHSAVPAAAGPPRGQGHARDAEL